MKTKNVLKTLDRSIQKHGSAHVITLGHLYNILAIAGKSNKRVHPTIQNGATNQYIELSTKEKGTFHMFLALSILDEQD